MTGNDRKTLALPLLLSFPCKHHCCAGCKQASLWFFNWIFSWFCILEILKNQILACMHPHRLIQSFQRRFGWPNFSPLCRRIPMTRRSWSACEDRSYYFSWWYWSSFFSLQFFSFQMHGSINQSSPHSPRCSREKGRRTMNPWRMIWRWGSSRSIPWWVPGICACSKCWLPKYTPEVSTLVTAWARDLEEAYTTLPMIPLLFSLLSSFLWSEYIYLHRNFFVLQCITQLTLLELEEEEEEEAAAPISFSGKPGNGKRVFVNRSFQLLPRQPSSDKCL